MASLTTTNGNLPIEDLQSPFDPFHFERRETPEIELADIYKGVVPFIILQLIGLFIVAMWPQLVIWLPAIAYG